MAGVKGRSGGARKGAGRKRKYPRPQAPTGPASSDTSQPGRQPPGQLAAPMTDAKVFLESVVAGLVFASEEQITAAKALLPFQHKKLGETGKKEQREAAAGKVSRFSAQPPRLAAVHGKKH